MKRKTIVLIPSLNPDKELINYVKKLVNSNSLIFLSISSTTFLSQTDDKKTIDISVLVYLPTFKCFIFGI